MRSIWVITKRELTSYFDSLIAYLMIIIFLILSGIFTWLYGSTVFLIGQADLQVLEEHLLGKLPVLLEHELVGGGAVVVRLSGGHEAKPDSAELDHVTRFEQVVVALIEPAAGLQEAQEQQAREGEERELLA